MILDRIRAAGFTMKLLPAGKLGVTGPMPTAEQIRFFGANKPDIIAELRAEAVQASPLVKSALDLWPGAEIVAIRDLRRAVADALADHEEANDPYSPRAWS